DEAGDIFYVVLADGAAAPTSTEVVNGTGNAGAVAVTSDNASVTIGVPPNDFSVTGLTAGTDYDVYVVARDDEGTPNLQGSPTKLDVTTEELISLTITGLTGLNKTYNGTTAASATGTVTLVGVARDHNVSLGGSPVFTFASANVGTGITIITTGYTISGTDSGKYILTQPTLSGDITAKELTITGITGSDKVYDDTTAATATGTFTLNGVESGDDVILGGTPVFTFASANVGTGITINTTGLTISGTDIGNYTLTQPTLSGDITAKELTITGITGDNKVYDDTTASTATGTAALSGIIGADDVILGGSPVFTFASANVDTGITITTTGYTISGTDSGNYTLTQPTLSGDISAKELTITGITGDDKVYDGTTAATATGTAILTGVEAGDDVILGGSPVFTFASASVGTGITITTTSYTISGTDSGNYTLTQPALSGDITPADLNVTADSATKVYGATDPVLTYTITGFQGTDTEADLDTAVSISRAVGEDVGTYTITPSAAADSNYTVSFVTADFTITQA
ncbi:MAG: YDG domain-containing protein, partial [Flavobacteriaceae bacterium]|nr:YDG domain-containing protein [Flavobacteriaceae bacterium]